MVQKAGSIMDFWNLGRYKEKIWFLERQQICYEKTIESLKKNLEIQEDINFALTQAISEQVYPQSVKDAVSYRADELIQLINAKRDGIYCVKRNNVMNEPVSAIKKHNITFKEYLEWEFMSEEK